jgi:hypothetical protein
MATTQKDSTKTPRMVTSSPLFVTIELDRIPNYEIHALHLARVSSAVRNGRCPDSTFSKDATSSLFVCRFGCDRSAQ